MSSRSCHDCKNQQICSIYKDINQVVSMGLKTHIITTATIPTELTKNSWMEIFKSLAGSCTRFTKYDGQELPKQAVKYAESIFKNLSKNKDFLKDYVLCISDEGRRRLVHEYLDLEYENIIEYLTVVFKNKEEAEDKFEVFQDYISAKFGL